VPRRYLEELARKTWLRLRYSREFGITQGEETITDLHLLEFRMSGISDIQRVDKCPKHLERTRGLDWEWIIGSNQFGWIKYAIQAKKLSLDINDLTKGRYKSLHQPFYDGSGTTQLEVLKSFARKGNMTPLYCLYNYIQKPSFLPYWNCNQRPIDEEQLGCTVTPLKIAETAIATRGGRRFDDLHLHSETIPWRCLVSCPIILDIYGENVKRVSKKGRRDVSSPNTIANELLGDVVVHNEPLDTLTTSFDSEIGQGPKRLVVLDIERTIRERIG